MALANDPRVLVKIAHLYFDDGLTQAEIADQMGVSRPLISKYLAKARELGIVEIRIHDQAAHPYISLEREMEHRFRLREAIVVDHTGAEGAVLRQVGQAAGLYLLRILKNGDILGVSWGTTVLEVAKALPQANLDQVTVVPLVGGVGDTRVDIHANQVAAKIAFQLGAEYKLLHAPVVVDSVEAKESLLSQPAIAEVFDTARRARVSLLGVGGTPENSTMRVCYFGDNDFLDMQASGVVGDICSQFYDRECNFDRFPWNSRVVALPVDQLKEIPVVIGVASGEHKVQALHAALRGRLIDVLVTDHVTAQGIMETN